MAACAVCGSPRRAEMEAIGKQGLLGETSWRQCALLAGANNPKSLQNHMQTHYDALAVVGDEEDWMKGAKAEILAAYRLQYEASGSADEKGRIWLKMKELQSANIRPDVLIRIWKEERELDAQRGLAGALAMFGKQMFAVPIQREIEAEVVTDDARPDKERTTRTDIQEPASD